MTNSSSTASRSRARFATSTFFEELVLDGPAKVSTFFLSFFSFLPFSFLVVLNHILRYRFSF